jgi:hypothetical protein
MLADQTRTRSGSTPIKMRVPAAGVVILLSAYAATYSAVVQRRYVPDRAEPYYGPCDSACQLIFAPAHQFDRWLRPGFWGPPACIW